MQVSCTTYILLLYHIIFVRTTDDAGGRSSLFARLARAEDSALAAVGGAEAEGLARRRAAGAAALTAVRHAARALGLDSGEAVAARRDGGVFRGGRGGGAHGGHVHRGRWGACRFRSVSYFFFPNARGGRKMRFV